MRSVVALAFAILAMLAMASAMRVVVQPATMDAALQADPAVKAIEDSKMMKKLEKEFKADLPKDWTNDKSVKSLLRDRFEESKLEAEKVARWKEWGEKWENHKEEIEKIKNPTHDPTRPSCKDCHYLPEPVEDPMYKIEDIPVPGTVGAAEYVDEKYLTKKKQL